MMKNTGIILLAAGNSSRMGSPKQLLVYQGKTFLERITDTAYRVISNQNKQTYIEVKDTDFHMLNKVNFMELFDE